MKSLFKILLVLQLPFWAGYGYIYLNVQKSVKLRKIHLAGLRQAELKKRNTALKKEIARLNNNSISDPGTAGSGLPGKNKVIYLDLPAVPKKNNK